MRLAALLLAVIAAPAACMRPASLSRRGVARAGVGALLGAGVATALAPRARAADGFSKTASGLEVQDVVEGSGATPEPGQTVKVHYTGWLDGFDGEKKFDSSYDRNRPLGFAVGTGRVIKGWDEALLSMKIGGTRRVVIPPDLGYGAKGAGGVIPGGATLYFEMKLLSAA